MFITVAGEKKEVKDATHSYRADCYRRMWRHLSM